MQQSTEYRQKTIKHIILSYETQPVLKSLFTACMQWYEVWRQHVYTTCRQSVTAGNHSVSSVWPAANISPLQHKLLHADFNLNHPGIQDLIYYYCYYYYCTGPPQWVGRHISCKVLWNWVCLYSIYTGQIHGPYCVWQLLFVTSCCQSAMYVSDWLCELH